MSLAGGGGEGVVRSGVASRLTGIVGECRVYGSSGYGFPADIWSLGVICFALLGGRFPYKQTEPRALVSRSRGRFATSQRVSWR